MRRSAPLVLASLILASILLPLQAGITAEAPPPADQIVGGLALTVDQLISKVQVPAIDLTELAPPPKPLRIAVISTGIDRSAFPAAIANRITELGSGGDQIGPGTQVASILFQTGDVALTSFGVYPNGKFAPDWLNKSLAYVASHASRFDALLYAVPTNEMLDPVSAAMANGGWNDYIDAISENPIPGSRKFGLAANARDRNAQLSSASPAERRAMSAFTDLVTRWDKTRGEIGRISAAGVPVVSPAGDLGPKLQTILGVANLADVITVGGFDGTGVSSRSSSGPSIEGRPKPDLVAPTGVVSFLPETSALATSLSSAGLLDPNLPAAWEGGEANTDARSRVDSTFVSAAYVTAAAARLTASGIRDTGKVRGALYAASVPLDGFAPWRQGAGVLKAMPTAEFAQSRTLATGPVSLGAQPDAGTWESLVPLAGSATAARASAPWFAGVGPAGNFERTAASSPALSVRADNSGLTVVAPLGPGTYEGGLYCGYTDVSIPLTGSTLSPSARIEGVPDGTEQVPTCLVQGTRLVAHNFYIHDTPAENLTFGLLPALPEEASLLEHHLMILPVDVLHTRLFMRVSGSDGNVEFPNIPPGYYKLRQWSDYGSPITSTLSRSSDGAPIKVDEEIGENPSYQSFDALVLSATGWTEQDLKNRFGEGNVTADKPTGGYFVQVGPRRIRVVLGYTKKMPGPGVSSRYIDLLKFSDLDFGSMPTANLNAGTKHLSKTPLSGMQAWSFGDSLTDPEAFAATFNPAHAASGAKALLGIGTYGFNIPTPNYKAHMSLNFSYALNNAVIGVIVQMGEETAIGVVTPQGTTTLPTISPSSPIDISQLIVAGKGGGKANFEFNIKPKGASHGTLTFVFAPSQPVRQLASPLSMAEVGDMSFELDTWTNTLWPAAATSHGQGHTFGINPNYSAAQMSDGCRVIDNGRATANVCEEWQMMVHSPGDDASTVDIVDANGSMVDALRSYGVRYFDPRRGVSDFSFGLVVPDVSGAATGSVVSVGASAALPFRTNGRFWEQIALTHDLIKAHPGPITIEIIDNLAGRQSTIADHAPGGVSVGPYVPF